MEATENKYRYIITLAYNGTRYHGWQIQPNAITIQQEIVNAIEMVLRHKICLHGAGRTDTGVHASFYVAHFDTINEIENPEKFIRSLNGILKNDISIYDIIKSNKDFHSRFNATSRTYKYFINKNKNPFIDKFSYKFHLDLNIDLMNKAAKELTKHSDFKSFEKSHSDSKTSICDVRFAKWEQNGNQLTFTITADRFLRNMVRSIVGTMLEVGQNKISVEQFKAIIDAQDRTKAGKSADARGLFLTDIQYPEPINTLLEKSRNLAKLPLF